MTVTSTATATATLAEAKMSTSPSLSLSPWLPVEALATPEETSAALGRTIATGVKAALTDLVNSERITLSTNWGPLLIVNLTSAQSSDQEVTTIVSEVGGTVLLSSAVLQALPPGANLAVLSVDPKSTSTGDEMDQEPFRGVQGGALSSLTKDISVYDAEGEYVHVELEQPMLFKLLFAERSSLTSAAELQCAFLETQANGQGVVWSTRGVWRATEAEVAAWGQAGEQEQNGIWCWTQHLSIFAAVSQVAFACTNLDLLQPEGLRAIFENEDWYLSSAALSTFCVVGVVLATVFIAILWELCQFRLGSTPGAVGKVHCWNFILCGPHLVKHRYAALLLYLRDLGHCFVTGRTKLRNDILTASVQRFLAVRTGISVACISQHCWNGGGWIDSPASLPKTTLCHKLKFYGGGAEEVIYREMFSFGIVPAARRLWLTTKALHPLLDATRVGAGSLTACKRSCLQVCGVIGVFATNAIIFNFSGELQSWEADARCPIKPGSHLFVVVATLVSIVVNALPNAFLMDLAKQVYRRPCWACVFWACLFAYASLALLIVTAVLANQNPKDQSLWHASVEWTITLKLAAMPLLQGLRNTLLLEAFLHEDRKLPPEKQFRVTMGLGHAKEEKLSQLEQQEVETMARQAISTDELVRFATLLGDRLMPDFDPDTSTSEDVFRKAIEPLCVKPPNLMDYPVLVQVEEVRGVRAPVEGQSQPQHLCCSVLHLGPQHQKRRPCLAESQSCPTSASADGSFRRCHWAFEARLLGLEPEHAIGFAVHERHGRDLAVAWLPALEVLKAGEWSGELTLQPAVEEDDEGGVPKTPRVSLAVPTEACPVHAHDLTVSQGVAASLRKDVQQARLVVRVRLSEGFLEALALHERQKLREWLPIDESELEEASADLAKRLMRLSSTSSGPDFTSALSSKPFCEAKTYLHSSEPPHTMVVHSGQSKFFHLVSAVLADALGEADHIIKVRAKLRDRDFHTILDMLQEAHCGDRRYWIDLFALNPSRLPAIPSQGSAEERLQILPSLLRSLRWVCCQKAVADIVGGQHAVCRPLTQLLVMDRDFHLMEENSCLAEMMLAKAMRVNQKMALHPEHLQGTSLAERLESVEGNFEEEGPKRKGISPGIAPYLQDGKEVYKTLVDLAVQNILVHREDTESTWKELNMTNMVLIAGTAAQPERSEGAHLRQSETCGPDDATFDE